MRAVTLLLCVLALQRADMPRGLLEVTVSDKDVAVFRAVLTGGVSPTPDVGDALTITAETPFLPTVSRTLRVCGTTEPADGVSCIPVVALQLITTKAASAEEVSLLRNGNVVSRVVPPTALLVIPPEQVFGGDHTWSAIWSRESTTLLPDCVLFSTPVYDDDHAAVYVSRVWKRTVWGWYVRLEGGQTRWRIAAKELVWRSHPGD